MDYIRIGQVYFAKNFISPIHSSSSGRSGPSPLTGIHRFLDHATLPTTMIGDNASAIVVLPFTPGTTVRCDLGGKYWIEVTVCTCNHYYSSSYPY